ncbi:C-X-C motif chemokine 6-like [Vulpes vulpes]|uniref:C-X-C motif chemokine n=1 Tax=Vulpes vulpes TaxID=9627 RepID=A0ABM4ZEM6_VULVU
MNPLRDQGGRPRSPARSWRGQLLPAALPLGSRGSAPPPRPPHPGSVPSIPKLEFPAWGKGPVQIKGVRRARGAAVRWSSARRPAPPPEPAPRAAPVAAMSLPPARAPCAPRAPRVPRLPGGLCALLLLLLLTPPRPLGSAGPVATIVRELRCVCLTTTPGIHPRMIAKVQVVAAGPQCPKVEVVATLKNRREVCLDPETPVLKKAIQKILDSGRKTN